MWGRLSCKRGLLIRGGWEVDMAPSILLSLLSSCLFCFTHQQRQHRQHHPGHEMCISTRDHVYFWVVCCCCFFPYRISVWCSRATASPAWSAKQKDREEKEGDEEKGREREMVVVFQVMTTSSSTSWIVGNEALMGKPDAAASLVMSQSQDEQALSKIHLTGSKLYFQTISPSSVFAPPLLHRGWWCGWQRLLTDLIRCCFCEEDVCFPRLTVSRLHFMFSSCFSRQSFSLFITHVHTHTHMHMLHLGNYKVKLTKPPLLFYLPLILLTAHTSSVC